MYSVFIFRESDFDLTIVLALSVKGLFANKSLIERFVKTFCKETKIDGNG